MRTTNPFLLLAFSAVAAWGQTAPAAPPQDVPQQDQQPSSGGRWRRIDTPAPAPAESVPSENPAAGQPNPPAALSTGAPLDAYGQSSGVPAEQNPQQAPPRRAMYPQAPRMPVPEELTLKPGTLVEVRIDQMLSSDHSAAGDPFTATLISPIVVDGVVVAQRGQLAEGRVVEASRSGRVQGTSRLAVELTSLTLADGNPLKIHSQFVRYVAPSSRTRDVGGVAGTMAVGAAIGAGVNGGVGAGVGAAAGLVGGVIGVLLTKGHETAIYPESVLTFRADQPAVISTAHAPQAFRFVDSRDYERDAAPRLQTRAAAPPPAYYVSPYGYPYYGGYYGGYYPYSPYLWGPSIGFYYGPRWYGGGHYYGRGGFRR